MSKLNPKASAFSFNPTASEFKPSWLATPADENEAESNEAPSTNNTATASSATMAASSSTSLSTDAADDRASAILLEAMSHASALTPDIDDTALLMAKAEIEDTETAKKTEQSVLLDHSFATSEIKLDEVEDEREMETMAPLAAAPSPSKKHVNLVFIGHVDAGKSTISGHIMYLTGMLDDRTLEKFEREAKQKGRESWKFAWALDLMDSERDKGITEDIGRAYFETSTKRFTILDAPGHKAFVPNMIGGATQADVGVLIISARKGEFETGFERGGQTREHAVLAKTAGIKHLVVAINKMDESTVMWSKERYDECVTKLTPFLKQVGFRQSDIHFMPISGLSGINLKERVSPTLAPWYEGESLLDHLEHLKPPERLVGKPVRMPICDRYRDMGTIIVGKLESGTVKRGDKYVILPNRATVEVQNVYIEQTEVEKAEPGDNIRLRIKGLEEDELRSGYVMCDINSPAPFVRTFDAQVIIMDHKSIMCAGYSCVLHVHHVQEEITIGSLLALMDRKTNKVIKKNPKFVKTGDSVIARIVLHNPQCVDVYKEFPQLGRFMLRDEGRTIGVGVIIKLHE